MGHRVISFCGSVRGCGLNLDKNLNANNLNTNNKIIGVEGQVVKKDSDENQCGKISDIGCQVWHNGRKAPRGAGRKNGGYR